MKREAWTTDYIFFTFKGNGTDFRRRAEERLIPRSPLVSAGAMLDIMCQRTRHTSNSGAHRTEAWIGNFVDSSTGLMLLKKDARDRGENLKRNRRGISPALVARAYLTEESTTRNDKTVPCEVK